MNASCQGLLDAQHAYTDAMRELRAHWTAMAATAWASSTRSSTAT